MTIPPQEMEQLHGYLDDTLPAAARTAFAVRVGTEPTLAAALAAEQASRAALRNRLRRTQAPAALHAQVRRALTTPPARLRWQQWWAWLSTPQPMRPLAGLAYTLLWLCVVGSAIWWSRQPAIDTTQALDTLFQRHAIYFEHQPALDVTGSASQISHWFTERLPYPVHTPTLSEGWQLTGARLDEFDQQPVAHLLYMRGNGQRTSLSFFPQQALSPPSGVTVEVADQTFWLRENGIHRAIVWYNDNLTYVLIGDIEVPSADLLQLAVEARTQLP